MSIQKSYNLTQIKVFELLKTRKFGLTGKEVTARQKKYGQNSLPEGHRASRLILLLNQFKSSLVYILLGAAGISLLLESFVDMYVILSAVIVNVIVGYVQESRAMKAMEKLRRIVQFQALVVRNGEEKNINVKDLVPGDIVVLEPGYKIPADIRFFDTVNLRINEARLTGESHPVTKTTKPLTGDLVLADRTNMGFMGTVVVGGSGRGVVCQTGTETELGQIAQMIKDTKEEKTPLQERLSSLSKLLGGMILLICLFIFAFGYFAGHGFLEMFTTSVAIAVAAIPEGLAVAVTVILAIGMQRILKHKALVRKLVAAETLGSTTVICTDKTGTLTEGEMKVVRVITNNQDFETHEDKFRTHLKETGASFIKALEIGVLCNDAHIENEYSDIKDWVIFGNPTEKALILAGSQVGLNRSNLEKVTPRIDTVPFTSERKFMMTLHHDKKDNKVIYLKGAPEKVLEMSDSIDVDGKIEKLTPAKLEKLKKRYELLSNKGLRIIALAYRSRAIDFTKMIESPGLYEQFVFVGFMGIKDPLRKETKETIDLCKKSGIKIVMITGDHKLTAQAIANELGLPAKAENVLEGAEMSKMNNTQLQERVKKISVYARVTPKDKLRIVDAWQAIGEVVAMTGDGVNDAPALRAADIGVAVGSGTDIAKETASLIILDDNFKTIVEAVRQGRVVFDNIRKVVLYLLSDSFSEVIMISVSLLLGFPLPLLAAQILWINLVTDGFPDIALTLEPPEKAVMEEPPIRRDEPIVNNEMKILIGVISLVTGLVTLGLFYFFYKATDDLDLARTIAFVSVGIDSLLYVFSCRSLRTSIFKKNPFSNIYLIIA
ncbi:HAD-IC family P-type ATPase, partial [Patescibacteria group bacterium]|nr:HAD-IC family P-type ATPase [Patescibacteria group bacterium]MBU1890366.1 HAD-IC family P-type ATPase [Patescibacteria group bacterium]